jgi:Transcription factor WhiB
MAAPRAGAHTRDPAVPVVPCARRRFNPDWWYAPSNDNLRGPTTERHRAFARRQCLTACPVTQRARCLTMGWAIQQALGRTHAHGLWGGVSFPATAEQVADARRQFAAELARAWRGVAA